MTTPGSGRGERGRAVQPTGPARPAAPAPTRGSGDARGSLPTVSLVIPTRNRRASLERTLAALRDDETLEEVVVVDDGSTDDTFTWLVSQTAEWPALKPVRTPGRGLQPTRAEGAAHATGEVVLFLDDDTVPARGLAEGHARHHRENEGIVVCGYYPSVLPSRPSAAIRLTARWYEADVAAVEATPARGLYALWGGNFSMRRADLVRIPLYAPEFGGSKRHADCDFGLRCQKAGLDFLLDRKLRADHHYSRTYLQFRDEARNSGYGMALVHRLHTDLLGPFPRELLYSRRRLVSALLRLTDWRPFYRLTAALLVAIARLCDATSHLDVVGDFAVCGLVRIEKRRGAHEYLVRAEPRHAAETEVRAGEVPGTTGVGTAARLRVGDLLLNESPTDQP